MKSAFLIFLSFLLYTLPSNGQNRALNFDGVDDEIQLQGLNLTGPFTIEVWVNPKAKFDFLTILSNKHGGFANPGFAFTINRFMTSAGEIQFESQSLQAFSTVNVVWDVWQHIAVTYDGTTLRMFLDGSEIGVNNPTAVSLVASPAPTYIGDLASYFLNAKFSGTMDELRIWNYARSTTQINTNLYGTLSGSEAGLMAYYDFEQGIPGGNNAGETSLIDRAGGDNNGALQLFALTGPASNWVGAPFFLAATIPTVSEWGLILLFLSFLSIGGAWMYSRKRKEAVA